jgi:hypothetical protein
MNDPHNQNDPPLSGEVIEGELVPYLFTGDRDRRSDRVYYDEETIAEAIRQVMAGHRVTDVAARVGCNRQTVWRWVNGAKDKLGGVAFVDLPRVRGNLALELETASHEAWKIVRAYPGTKIALDAIVVINNLARNRAVLLGANAPVVVQVDHNVVTESDRELEELINEAKAKAANEVEAIKQSFESGQSS